MKFSTWAPLAENSVELVCAQERIALARTAHGHWQVDCRPARITDGYKFSIDGAAPIPDPKSAWQPDGVHGASFVVDETVLKGITRSSFQQKPLREAIIYELHIGTFTPAGTYAGATGKLPHLAALGVTHIELMPLATFPGHHGWGYDGVFLFAPHPAYGTPEQLARFIAACHEHGLAVLLDVVYNHLGPDGNYLPHYAPYFSDRVKTAWGHAINYDGEYSDGVRDFVVDNALMWLDVYGFDGLRLDAAHAIFTHGAVHVLEDLRTAVDAFATQAGRTVVLIAESDLNGPRLIHPPSLGGYGLDAQWADDFHHALHRLMTAETSGYYVDFNGLEDLVTALQDGYVYQGRYSSHRKRRHGRPPVEVKPDQIVVCAQNHDQIGNRAKGERLSMLLTTDQVKAAAALTVLSPFVPLLFQGEEWGATTAFLYFTDHQDQQLGKLVAEGRRKEFASFSWHDEVPDPQAPESFTGSQLNWSEVTLPGHRDILTWYRRLIALRAEGSQAASAPIKVSYDAQASWLSFVYRKLCIAVNFNSRPCALPLPNGSWRLLLSSASDLTDAPLWAAYETRIYGQGP